MPVGHARVSGYTRVRGRARVGENVSRVVPFPAIDAVGIRDRAPVARGACIRRGDVPLGVCAARARGSIGRIGGGGDDAIGRKRRIAAALLRDVADGIQCGACLGGHRGVGDPDEIGAGRCRAQGHAKTSESPPGDAASAPTGGKRIGGGETASANQKSPRSKSAAPSRKATGAT